MRHQRLTLGLAATACMFAFAATPALAHEFTASATGALKAVTNGEQKFKFGPFKITCKRVTAKGFVVAGSSTTFASSNKYVKCGTAAFIGSTNNKITLGTTFKTPLAIEYHASGFVETGSELGEELDGEAVLAGGSAEIKVNTGVRSKCTLFWPEQKLPLKGNETGTFSAAKYNNVTAPKEMPAKFPDGKQHSLVVENNFKNIKFEVEGEPCQEWIKEDGEGGVGGTYLGSVREILTNGNLEFS
jgi:hypothetical protein